MPESNEKTPEDDCMIQGGCLILAENHVDRKELDIKELLWPWTVGTGDQWSYFPSTMQF